MAAYRRVYDSVTCGLTVYKRESASDLMLDLRICDYKCQFVIISFQTSEFRVSALLILVFLACEEVDARPISEVSTTNGV